MTAPAKIPTEVERMLNRLRDASLSLESAVSRADDAIGEIRGALAGPVPPGLPDSAALADLVVRLHDDEHDGPIRWCAREACRAADEIRSAR